MEEVDGHDPEKLFSVFSRIPFAEGKPSAIIAHTVKGKGVSYMENVPMWHYRAPSPEEYQIALEELS